MKVIAKKSIKINQWKNTASVLTWFNGISNKDQYSFIAFDVVDFYPSISIDLLNVVLDLTSNNANITNDERDIILHAKNRAYIMIKNTGARKNQTTYLTLLWVVMTEQKRAI